LQYSPRGISESRALLERRGNMPMAWGLVNV
jgi:hypothetical protein